MILDERLEFADALAVAGAAGTVLLGDVVDLGAAARDIGLGDELWFVMTTDTEVITAGAAGTIQFKLVSDAQAAIATDGSATEHLVTAALVTDDAAVNDSRLNAGGLIYAARVPPGSYERYLGVLSIIATAAVTAGKVNAFLTKDIAKWTAYDAPASA